MIATPAMATSTCAHGSMLLGVSSRARKSNRTMNIQRLTVITKRRNLVSLGCGLRVGELGQWV